MAFRITGNLGDEKPFFRMGGAVSGTAHVEVIIDDKSIDREHASRLLRMMAERLLECNWPPDQAYGSPMPSTITALGMITGS
jgi:hypothetical protein